jgi:hypothetical protein
LFGTFAKRYAKRPGGYTRIHKFGHRPGDNAPTAILELVDNPRDIKLEITARAVGWELLKEKLQTKDVSDLLQKGVKGAELLVADELALERKEVGRLRPATRWNLQKVARHRDPTLVKVIGKKAQDHIVCPLTVPSFGHTHSVPQNLLLAKPVLMRTVLDHFEKRTTATEPKKQISLRDYEMKRASFYRDLARAGQARPGETKSAIRISQGALARPERKERRSPPNISQEPKSQYYTFSNIYGTRT